MSYQLNFTYDNHTIQSPDKRKPFFFIFLLIFSVILYSMISGCTARGSSNPDHSSENLAIACTIPPQGEYIKAIEGNETRIMVMVPPGASPHTFEPTPSQIAELESADMYIYLGSGIEFENQWLERIKSMYPDLPLVNASENITLFLNDEENQEELSNVNKSEHRQDTDPHVWLSIKNTKSMVNTTCNALLTLRPHLQDQFRKNEEQYLSKLDNLDMKINKTLSDLPSRKILVYHPAFGYFCRDYNLTQISVEENGKEPSAKSLASLIDMAKKERISYIFTEPEVSTQGADTLAANINASVILISPLAGDYLENMESVADRIAGST